MEDSYFPCIHMDKTTCLITAISQNDCFKIYEKYYNNKISNRSWHNAQADGFLGESSVSFLAGS